MARGRHGTLARCAVCGLHLHLCACSLRPRWHAPLPIIVIQHRDEAQKPTNSARSLVESLALAQLLTWNPEAPDALLELDAVPDPVLLFARREGCAPRSARELEQSTWDGWRDTLARRSRAELSPENVSRPPPSHLVMLDGTWRQCARMQHKLAPIAAMDFIALPMRGASRWRVRIPTDPCRLSTFEAGLQALSELSFEVHATQHIEGLQTWFEIWSTRMLFMKHKVPLSRLDAAAAVAHLEWERSHPSR